MSVREALHHEIVCYCRVNEHVSNITVVIPEYSSMLLDREKHPMQEEMSRDFKLHRWSRGEGQLSLHSKSVSRYQQNKWDISETVQNFKNTFQT